MHIAIGITQCQAFELYHFRAAGGPSISAFNLVDIQELIRNSNPLAFEALELLTPNEMETTKYNVAKVRELTALKGNESKEAKLLMMLNTAFTVGRKYMTEQIKRKLQSIYNQLEIRDGDGKIKIATAKQLEEPGRFELKACKVKNILGKWENGYTILSSISSSNGSIIIPLKATFSILYRQLQELIGKPWVV